MGAVDIMQGTADHQDTQLVSPCCSDAFSDFDLLANLEANTRSELFLHESRAASQPRHLVMSSIRQRSQHNQAASFDATFCPAREPFCHGPCLGLTGRWCPSTAAELDTLVALDDCCDGSAASDALGEISPVVSLKAMHKTQDSASAASVSQLRGGASSADLVQREPALDSSPQDLDAACSMSMRNKVFGRGRSLSDNLFGDDLFFDFDSLDVVELDVTMGHGSECFPSCGSPAEISWRRRRLPPRSTVTQSRFCDSYGGHLSCCTRSETLGNLQIFLEAKHLAIYK